jgi:trehalose utilization protein
MANENPVRVLVWDENPPHAPKEIYPKSINGAIVDGLHEFGGGRIQAKAVNLDDPDQGITEAALAETDVLIWWGHARHGQVRDEIGEWVKDRVYNHGLGFVPLHSAHYSKPFRAVVGPGHLKGGWREDSKPEVITVCAPQHPIAQGISSFTLESEEMYGSPFVTPPPTCLVFQSYFPAGGEYFPSGIAWSFGQGIDPDFTSGPGGGKGQGEGAGRVFYFRPGHETIPTYFNENVRKVIANATLWAARRI